MNERARRAALYARVSSIDQAAPGTESLSAQERDMRAHCERQGYEAVELFVDVQSGADRGKQRSEFGRMLQGVREGRFDLVLCWKFDRIFRGPKPLVELESALDTVSAEVEAVHGHVDRSLLGIWAALSRMELKTISERARMGKRGMARHGKYALAIAPFGYRIDPQEPSRLAVDDTEAAVVRHIFELYTVEGLSIRGIARRLNEEGAPTRGLRSRSPNGQSKGWIANQVARLLAREAYVGVTEYAKHYVDFYSGRSRKETPEALIRIPVPPIVSSETWAEARKRAEANRYLQPLGGGTPPNLLQGLTYCRVCGHRLRSLVIPAGRRRKDGNGYEYTTRRDYRGYVCRGQQKYPELHQCRTPAYIQAQALEKPVLAALYKALKNPDVLYRAAGVSTEDGAQPKRRADGLQRKLAEARRERDGAVSLAARGKITEDDLAARLADLDGRTAALENELEGLREREEQLFCWEEERRQLQVWLGGLQPMLRDIVDVEKAPELQRELLVRAVDKVWVDRQGHVEIEGAINLPATPRPFQWKAPPVVQASAATLPRGVRHG